MHINKISFALLMMFVNVLAISELYLPTSYLFM